MTSRPHVSADEYLTIARQIAAGTPHPFYGSDLDDVLQDVALAVHNETKKLSDRLDVALRDSRRAKRAEALVWRLVRAAGKRKTLQTADVRAALDGTDPTKTEPTPEGAHQ